MTRGVVQGVVRWADTRAMSRCWSMTGPRKKKGGVLVHIRLQVQERATGRPACGPLRNVAVTVRLAHVVTTV